MRFCPTELAGVIIVEPDVHRDARGFFLETYHAEQYRTAGITGTFVQENHSLSGGKTIRGLHAQVQHPQGKLIRVIEGEIFDVAVDIRRGSPTYMRWVSVILSAANFRQLYIPPGFAHGFAVTTTRAQVVYKCTEFYDPTDEISLAWNDSAIGVEWPFRNPVLSERDRLAPSLTAVEKSLPVHESQ